LRQIKATCGIIAQGRTTGGPQMLPISADKVAEVIILARELDRAENEFDGFVDRLNEDEQAGLVALFWIGRGTFDPEDLAEAIRTAMAEATTPTARYLKGSPHLADHLASGLEALGIDSSAVEDELYRPV
jgi:GH24 family phage-related lysozyme (muramidase)